MTLVLCLGVSSGRIRVGPIVAKHLGDSVQYLGAARCDADVPCSENTAAKPASSLTLSPRKTTRPL